MNEIIPFPGREPQSDYFEDENGDDITYYDLGEDAQALYEESWRQEQDRKAPVIPVELEELFLDVEALENQLISYGANKKEIEAKTRAAWGKGLARLQIHNVDVSVRPPKYEVKDDLVAEDDVQKAKVISLKDELERRIEHTMDTEGLSYVDARKKHDQ